MPVISIISNELLTESIRRDISAKVAQCAAEVFKRALDQILVMFNHATIVVDKKDQTAVYLEVQNKDRPMQSQCGQFCAAVKDCIQMYIPVEPSHIFIRFIEISPGDAWRFEDESAVSI